jgi:signal transduction histidine kinase
MTEQQYDLSTLAMHELVEIGARIRRCADVGPAPFDQLARAIVDTFWGALVERVPPQLAMLRLYRVRSVDALESSLRALVPEASGDARVLVLAATRGLEAAWNDVATSHGHRVLPLSDPGAIARAPLVGKLVNDLALDRPGDPEVFYVADAIGSPLIPSQESFVLRYGVRSVIAAGGLLASPHVGFALLAFSRVALSNELVHGYGDLGLCAGIALSHASDLDVPRCALAEARARALQRLLDREEPLLITRMLDAKREHEQLRATHTQYLKDVAADASARAKHQERTQRAMLNVIEDLREARTDLERRVDARTAELRQRNEELRSTNAELEQFAYVASHDLQEPLRTIAGYLQLLEERHGDRLDDNAREYIGYSVAGARRMQELIDALLAYSRVSRAPLAHGMVSLDGALDDALQSLARALEDSRARIVRDPLPTIRGDRVLLRQLFQNLISNAIKFAGAAPPQIEITCEHAGDGLRLRVQDHGIGFEPKYADQIFKLFRRLQRKLPGTGIGLAICKKIVERHGGAIAASSIPGNGAVLTVTLPGGS